MCSSVVDKDSFPNLVGKQDFRDCSLGKWICHVVKSLFLSCNQQRKAECY